MGAIRGKAPRTFVHRTTTDKLGRDLDTADDLGLDVLLTQHVGGRDWVIVTRPGPIIGPAARRVAEPYEE